jgi:hypothetical protein
MRWLLPLLLACADAPEDTPPTPTDTPVDTQLDCGGRDRCGATCTDLLDDPLNCGLCGRTCVIPNGLPACVAGECVLQTCEAGWTDCDGVLDNGCESLFTCTPDEPCETACGSVGTTRCDDCTASCELPVETCNGQDDDCDGTCDDASCRVGIHRAFGSTTGHDYGPDEAEIVGRGANIEVLDYFRIYADPVDGYEPLFRCVKTNGKRFLTRSATCEGLGAPESTLGYVTANPSCASTPLYRLLNAGSAAHFYTLSASERDNARDNLGFVDEGVVAEVWR